jgi:UDP-N-acetylglucosamine 2-epimerase (non-hydrolysing)
MHAAPHGVDQRAAGLAALALRPALVVIGTRPERIKLGPVARALRAAGAPVHVLFTGQHRELGAASADALALMPDEELAPAAPDERLEQSLARQLGGLGDVIARIDPALVIAQGDTTAAMAAALAALYNRRTLAHVEAGLRSASLWSPHPEEGHRRAIAALTSWHFAPTLRAQEALLAEGVPATRIVVTGNTAIDALREAMAAGIPRSPAWMAELTAPALLVTMHRRENMGERLAGVMAAVAEIAARWPALPIIWPLHPNPAIGLAVRAALGQTPGVRLCAALPYPELLGVLSRSALVLTDSGGLQEEAPALGVPVLVARDETERVEGIEAGLARMVGCDAARIIAAVDAVMSAPDAARGALRATPYGDGFAAERIARTLWTADGWALAPR